MTRFSAVVITSTVSNDELLDGVPTSAANICGRQRLDRIPSQHGPKKERSVRYLQTDTLSDRKIEVVKYGNGAVRIRRSVLDRYVESCTIKTGTGGRVGNWRDDLRSKSMT